MLLVHDVGEIDAADVMFFAHVNWEERKAAERAAVMRIFSILPEEDSSTLLQLWQEFEAGESAEAPHPPIAGLLANRERTLQ